MQLDEIDFNTSPAVLNEVTEIVMKAFIPVIHDIKWFEKCNAWRVKVGLFGNKDASVWVDKSFGRVYFEKEVGCE